MNLYLCLSPTEEEAPNVSAAKQFFKKALEKTRASAAGALAATSSIDGGVDGSLSSTIPSTSALKIGSEPVTRVANVCNMYQAALKTLAQLKLEILQVPYLITLIQFSQRHLQ